jgi:hypothetical protein
VVANANHALSEFCRANQTRERLAGLAGYDTLTFESRVVRPDVLHFALRTPLCWVGIVSIGTSGFALAFGLFAHVETCAFVASNFFIIGLVAIGAAAIFPVMLDSTLEPKYSLTATQFQQATLRC